MEIGIDSFAATRSPDSKPEENVIIMEEVIQRIEQADKSGLHMFGLGEHHRSEFLDSAAHMILAAASQRTKNIRLASAVVVLSATDPVRVFQNYATLDLLSKGRAEIVTGRGSFTESFPLFGFNLHDYDALYTEKLDLLLKIREKETLSWSGKFRAPMHEQSIYPRPIQSPLPIWVGVGGTPQSFQRAGLFGLPLMVAIIGGETHRFNPLIDVYRKTYVNAGHSSEHMKIGIHSQGYVAETMDQAVDDYYHGYKMMFDKIGLERGWPPVTKDRFLFQNGPTGAYLVGDPETVATKILRHSKSLGGVSRYTFMMDNAGLTQDQILRSIKLIGSEVIPRVNEGLE
ncbi:MAG: LLM class flavin-dependent oxidoreductase [Candidatus Heimdallarchaeota archaeon]|nr:LLM class flavin-dependent oxidoreductase [Candidatus Heimdallarchaeota archaeon]